MCNDLIDFFRSGKDRIQNTAGADIRKNFFQAVLPWFQPAIDAKNIFRQDYLASFSAMEALRTETNPARSGFHGLASTASLTSFLLRVIFAASLINSTMFIHHLLFFAG
jgi:hypothetical protein